jgi:undecaprenyl-diphosphatase
VIIAVEAGLLIGTLVLAGIVKAHPGPLPGDLGLILAWQHLVRPGHLFMSFLSFVTLITWQTYVVGQVTAIVVLLLLWRRWLDLIIALGVVCLSPGTNYVIMRIIDRPRPTGPGLYVQEQVTTYSSFPSGHVEYILAFLGFMLFLSFQVRRPHAWLWLVRLLLLTMIVFIGPSRLAMGEHWPSDTLAGLLWGGFWLIAAIQVYRWAVPRWPRLVPPNEREESQALTSGSP